MAQEFQDLMGSPLALYAPSDSHDLAVPYFGVGSWETWLSGARQERFQQIGNLLICGDEQLRCAKEMMALGRRCCSEQCNTIHDERRSWYR